MMIQIKELDYKILRASIFVIFILIAISLVLMTNKISNLQKENKEIKNNYTNLNEKVNRIRAELVIKNEYLEK